MPAPCPDHQRRRAEPPDRHRGPHGQGRDGADQPAPIAAPRATTIARHEACHDHRARIGLLVARAHRAGRPAAHDRRRRRAGHGRLRVGTRGRARLGRRPRLEHAGNLRRDARRATPGNLRPGPRRRCEPAQLRARPEGRARQRRQRRDVLGGKRDAQCAEGRQRDRLEHRQSGLQPDRDPPAGHRLQRPRQPRRAAPAPDRPGHDHLELGRRTHRRLRHRPGRRGARRRPQQRPADRRRRALEPRTQLQPQHRVDAPGRQCSSRTALHARAELCQGSAARRPPSG